VLSYALWALGHHCDAQYRVAAEVADLPDRALTHEDVQRLGYTVQVLHEALRLCPPGASVPRTVMRDIAVDGFRLEAGTLAVVGIYAMHRDPELWDDPLVFDPDRFSKERSAGRSRWQYLPFGAGRRSCVGDHFAMLEATLALATIVRQVEIRSLDDDFPVATPFTLVAAAPIRAQVQPRHTRRLGDHQHHSGSCGGQGDGGGQLAASPVELPRHPRRLCEGGAELTARVDAIGVGGLRSVRPPRE
jgi:cytochrome P450